MDKRLIHLLDSSDVSERERAIKAMARSRDSGYISYLNVVVKTDPDAGLRSLAAKAIQYIRQQSGESAEDADDAHGRTTPKRVEVSAANERRAASMLDRAMELITRHQDEAARELVVRAYQLDPNIRLDGYKRGIVGTVMGMGADQAFDLLDEQVSALPEKAKGKAKEKNDASSSDEEANWGTALLDLLIYGAVIAVTIIGSYFLLIQIGGAPLQQLAATNDIINGLLRAGTAIVLVNAVLAAIFSTILTFIGSVFIHLAANFLGGDGTLPRLINKTVPIYTLLWFVWLVVNVVSALIALSSFMSLWEQNAVVESTSSGFRFEASFETSDFTTLGASMGVLNIINPVMMLIYMAIIVWRITIAYNFSWVRGCGAYIIGVTATIIISCGLVFLLTSILASSLSATFAMLPS